jgi:hypothetical protein
MDCETTCDACDVRIHERDQCPYEPLGIIVCESCFEMLTNGGPKETTDISMDELMDALPS